MNAVRDDGSTNRDHLEAAARQPRNSKAREAARAKLNGSALPACILYLWRWFLDLHNGRPSGGFGPGAITYSDMHAWAALTGNRPTPWDVETIKQLDYAYLKHSADQARKSRKKKNKGSNPPKRG